MTFSRTDVTVLMVADPANKLRASLGAGFLYPSGLGIDEFTADRLWAVPVFPRARTSRGDSPAPSGSTSQPCASYRHAISGSVASRGCCGSARAAGRAHAATARGFCGRDRRLLHSKHMLISSELRQPR